MKVKDMLMLLHRLEQLHRHDHWTRRELETYQAASLQHLREYTYAHSAFYKRFHKGLEGRPLSDLPALTKAMVMEHFDEVVTDPAISLGAVRNHGAGYQEGMLYLDRYRVLATSGSTGQPGLFVFNQGEWATLLALSARMRTWAGLPVNPLHRMKTAVIASTFPSHGSSQLSASLQSWFVPTLRFAATEPLEAIVAGLNTWQPEMLSAYASLTRALADEQLAGRLAIYPRLVFTGGEVLTGEARQRIKAAWGAEPFNQYGATEAVVAMEGAHHRGMEMCEDTAIIEVVDEDNRPVPPGVHGAKVLVTVLFRYAQPLIRYELSDSVRISAEPNPAGRPYRMIDAVQGRVEDVLTLPAEAGGDVAVQPLVFSCIMDTLPVGGWQVVQEADGLRILLSGAPDGLVDGALTGELARALAGHGVRVPRIRVQHVLAIPQIPSGKTPLIKAHPLRERHGQTPRREIGTKANAQGACEDSGALGEECGQ